MTGVLFFHVAFAPFLTTWGCLSAQQLHSDPVAMQWVLVFRSLGAQHTLQRDACFIRPFDGVLGFGRSLRFASIFVAILCRDEV